MLVPWSPAELLPPWRKKSEDLLGKKSPQRRTDVAFGPLTGRREGHAPALH